MACIRRKEYLISKKCERCKHRKECGREVIGDIAKKMVFATCIIFALILLIAFEAMVDKTETEVAEEETEVITSSPEFYGSQSSDDLQTIDGIVITEMEDEDISEQNDEATEGTKDEESETLYYGFTEAEVVELAKEIYAEARGECYEGKVAVAAVALNRLETGYSKFGAENGSLVEVLRYSGAFAPTSWITDFESQDGYEECMEAAKAAIAGYDPTEQYFNGGALYFYSAIEPLSSYEEARRVNVYKVLIGNQYFHREIDY